MYSRIIGCFFFTMLVFTLAAQDLSLSDDDIEWSEGTVTLTSGQVLNGLVKYNSKTALLKFENGKQSKALTARGVTQFEYFDAVRNVQRKFYSIEAEDYKDVKRPQFFELLKELKTFAVIYSQNPMELKQQQGWGPAYRDFFGNNQYNSNRMIVASQKEMIFLMDEAGELFPYMTITYEEKPRDLVDGSKSKIKTKVIGEDFLKKLTGEHYPELKKYAKLYKLDFDNREDFLRILDHYEQLTAE
jgi:hypothetical protein